MFPRTAVLALIPLLCALCGCAPDPAPQAPAEPAAPGRTPPGPPDVILYLIDTLRKDHLGCYHYPLPTSPQIDAFARDAAIFHDFLPMSSWTRPSVASLLTGTMDYTHHTLSPEDHLREGLPSLARTLHAHGWSTHALVTNPAVASNFGFGRDFQNFEDLWIGRQPVDWQADIVALDSASALLAQPADQPRFLYLHTMAPHRDYNAPPDYEALFMPDRFVGTRHQVRIAKDLAKYDAEIRFSDDQFARLIQTLKDTGRYDNALIVLLSDHGEQFMEHGEMAHAKSLHFAELGVPLLVKLPGRVHAGRAVKHTVTMADLAPTLLDALGLPPDPAMDGRSLLPLITLEGAFPPAPAFSRLRFEDRHRYSAQTPDLKFMFDRILNEATWYNLDQDPLEQFPLRQPPPGGEALRSFADEIAARPLPAPGENSPALTDTQREALEALGYL